MDCFVASAQNCFAILSRVPRNDGDGRIDELVIENRQFMIARLGSLSSRL
jgi:hypothetical protein